MILKGLVEDFSDVSKGEYENSEYVFEKNLDKDVSDFKFDTTESESDDIELDY